MAEGKYKFEKLTPIDNVDLNVYEEALDFVFKNDDIKNVAVSGAYSAGKSSVLVSYKKKHKEKCFLHISLAHFQFLEPDEDEKNKEIVLEGKILNQLIHQISAEKIPQTNFKVKKGIRFKSVLQQTILIMLLIVFSLHMSFFSQWKVFVSLLPNGCIKNIFNPSVHVYSLLASGLIVTLLVGTLLFKVVEIQKNRNIFRKLKFQGNEIEILEDTEDSYFDKYLNEVLYLFENAEADVIVFEDMDRFNTGLVFEHLREVNTLVNIQLKKDGKKALRFFYLLRDDIFISKDRTKFFDYIIPIVPVVDGSNSYDKFIEHFRQAGILNIFDISFLQGLSLYIDDMRLLKNIYNEFIVYYNRLNTTELNPNRMLGMIAYKNLFPRDFNDLQLNQGFVYTLFVNKDRFIREEIEQIQQRINEKNQRIERIESEQLNSVRELCVVFADKYLKNYSWQNYDDSGLEQFISRHLSGKSFEEYSSRKLILTNKVNGNVSVLETEREELEHTLIDIKSSKLSQLITRENVDTIFSITSKNEIGKVTEFKEIKGSEYFELLKYLIRNGYIDETYADYMTYFYEDSLNRIDKTFLRSVTDQKAKEYTYKLKKPEMVISRLRFTDFDQVEVLNFDLLKYLLNTPEYMEYLNRLLKQLRETNNFKFIGSYFDWITDKSAYVRNLNLQWPELFYTIIEKNALTEKQTRLYSVYTIYYSDEYIIEKVNKDECLQQYISNSNDYLNIETPDIDKLIRGFSLLKVCFVKIDYEKSEKRLLLQVFCSELYEINSDNIEMILKNVYKLDCEDDIMHRNYTMIISQEDTTLANYVQKNMEIYMNVVLEMSQGVITDEENAALEILNNINVSIEQKERYIEALRTNIQLINTVFDRALWKMLLGKKVALFSEKNIMEYFVEKESVDDCLATFINEGAKKLDFSKISSQYDSEQMETFFDAIVVSGAIHNNKYRECIVSLDFCYDDFNVRNLSENKLQILLDENVIKMTIKSLQFLRENYPNQVFYYIRKYIDEYVAVMDSSTFLFEELLEILTWNIAENLKMQLLEFTDAEISIIDRGYSTSLCVYIMKHNLMNSDLTELFSSYEKYDVRIQEVIFKLALENISDIVKNPKDISTLLKHNLMCSVHLNSKVKIELFVEMIPELKKTELEEIFTILNLKEYLKIFDSRTRPKFPVDDMNNMILSTLKENGLIRDYTEDINKPGYYKISKAVLKKDIFK